MGGHDIPVAKSPAACGTTGAAGAEAIHDTLRHGYRIRTLHIKPLPAGQATWNYRVETQDGPVFVKVYPPAADLTGEREAIDICRHVGRCGIPTPRLRRDRDGHLIHHGDRLGAHWVSRNRRSVSSGSAARGTAPALSVWDYVPAAPALDGLSPARMMSVGIVLGRLHETLARYRPARPRPPDTSPVCDMRRAAADIDDILAKMARRRLTDEFSAWVVDALRQRRAMLPHIGELMAGLPRLDRQILHGDMSAPNVLFDADAAAVAALVDFSPPRRLPIAWEIGRIGCDPQTILRHPTWLDGLTALIAAYRAQRPAVRIANLTACVRLWICATVTSTYAIRHILAGTAAQPHLFEAYVRARQDAMVQALRVLTDIEDALDRASRGR
jgi:Ser/Thr protein kinase RdoA (MazF antagonist)